MSAITNQDISQLTSKDVDRQYFRPLAQCFSLPVLFDLISRGRSDYLTYVLNKSGYATMLPKGVTFLQLFDDLYWFLSANYRAEYVYKNTLAHDIVIERHLPQEATIHSELRVDISKADIVITNGTSSVYEIKTEYDNTNRLTSQIDSYRQAFDRIYVVTHSNLLSNIKPVIDSDIGIMLLTDDMSFKTVREARSNRHRVNPEVIFDILRRDEYVDIIQEHFGIRPDVPNGVIYNFCRDLFIKIPPGKAHDAMVSALRHRQSKIAADFIAHGPASLRILALTSKFTKKQFNLLMNTLQKTYNC